MSNATDPRAFLRPEHGFNHYSAQGTSVAIAGQGLLILGAPASGKSSLAAQMIALGAQLVADDLTVIAHDEDGPICKRPDHGPQAIELRGFGIVPTPTVWEAPFRQCLLLQSELPERLPAPEHLHVFGVAVPLNRAIYAADLGAKLLVLMGGAGASASQKPVGTLPDGKR